MQYDCEENICENGGDCFKLNDTLYCNCAVPYFGKNCSHSLCSVMKTGFGNMVQAKLGINRANRVLQPQLGSVLVRNFFLFVSCLVAITDNQE